MKTIADATILIHLAKAGKIDLLSKIFDTIIIENEVYREILERGEAHSEVPIIKKLIEEGYILVREVSNIIDMPHLDEGEKRSISLCKEMNISSLLIDEEEGFNIALMLHLSPIRTTSLLIILLDRGLISLKEYESSLRSISESGYFLDAVTYERLITLGKNIAKK